MTQQVLSVFPKYRLLNCDAKNPNRRRNQTLHHHLNHLQQSPWNDPRNAKTLAWMVTG